MSERTCSVELFPRPLFDGAALAAPLRALRAVGFEPDAARRLLLDGPCIAGIDHGSVEALGRPAAAELLDLQAPHSGFVLAVCAGADRRAAGLSAAGLHRVADLIRGLRDGAELDPWRALGQDLPRDLERDRQLRVPLALPDGPSIVRLAHAELLVSSGSARILIDPIGLSGLPKLGGAPLDLPPVDAIFVTHTHADHLHLPSLLLAARRPDVPVYVPRVPRRSVLAPFAPSELLDAAGQRCVALAWGQTVEVGDLRIEALPMYGEQPTVDVDGAPSGVRNWGQCLRIDCAEGSIAVLCDAGRDPDGDIALVLADSAASRGPLSLVTGSLRTFHAPFFGGLPHDWLTVPLATSRRLFERFSRGDLPSSTAGPSGIARGLSLSGAAAFAPSADGFEGMGAPLTDVGWGEGEPAEGALMAVIARQASARLFHWSPGDALLLRRGEVRSWMA